jgi:putative PIN family toxin of toxin-antitoxin system
MIRAVVDINVIVSAAIIARGNPFQVWSAWRAERFTLVSSEGILAELREKLESPRIAQRYGLSTREVAAILSLLRTQAALVPVPAREQLVVTADPEDDLVLATGRVARANYLVTGDGGLLALGAYQDLLIVTPRDFLAILDREEERTSLK